MITVTKKPQLIEAAYNKITFEVRNTEYKIGDLFFISVLDEYNNLVTSLVKNGLGDGRCEFDVSTVVQSLFPVPKILNSTSILQSDESALVGYKVKIGVVKLVNRTQAKKYYYSSDTLYALRAALPVDESETIDDLVVDYTNEIKFLTSITPNQSQASDIYLPVLVTAPTTVKLVVDFYSQIKETTHTLNDLGVYVFNVKPELQGLWATGFKAWLESNTKTYISTMSATVNCTESGTTGSYTASATEYSTVSLADASEKALIRATQIATSNLVCEPVETFTSTKSHTAVCGSGYTGSYTSEQTATSYISQDDADAKASAAAKADAEANLMCAPSGGGVSDPVPPHDTAPTQAEIDAAYQNGYGDGQADKNSGAAYKAGYSNLYTKQALIDAYIAGYDAGWNSGTTTPSQEQLTAAYNAGYADGANDGQYAAINQRYDSSEFTTQAEKDQYDLGYYDGYQSSYQPDNDGDPSTRG